MESELPNDEDSAAVLTRLTSQSYDMSSEPELHVQEQNTASDTFGGSDDSETGGEIKGGSRDQRVHSDSPVCDEEEKPIIRKERFTIQDGAYDKRKAPRKSVLKKRPGAASPVLSSYAAPSSPSVSPTGSEQRRQDQNCCTIL